MLVSDTNTSRIQHQDSPNLRSVCAS